jgi:hypothetical protein
MCLLEKLTAVASLLVTASTIKFYFVKLGIQNSIINRQKAYYRMSPKQNKQQRQTNKQEGSAE